MSPEEQQALSRIVDSLELLVRELRELAGPHVVGRARKAPSSPRSEPAGAHVLRLDGLRSMGRTAAAQQLSSFSHKQLGDLFIDVGGTSRDKKRKKEWLIE